MNRVNAVRLTALWAKGKQASSRIVCTSSRSILEACTLRGPSLLASMRFSATCLASVGALLFAAGCSTHASSGNTGSHETTIGGNVIAATPATNAQVVTVSSGPATADSVNGVYTDVTICTPGTTICQVVSNVLVDTGSFGLRILSSVLSSQTPLLSLTQEFASTGGELAECVKFFDSSFIWGPVKLADVVLAGEPTIHNLPIHVIADPGFLAIPSGPSGPNGGCNGSQNENTVHLLGANGILGVGLLVQDCGSACTATPQDVPPGTYYACDTHGQNCQVATATLQQQVQNPVALLQPAPGGNGIADSNGVILELPSISSTGQMTTTGALVFGIGTQSNNALGSATVFAADIHLNFNTVYKGQSLPDSFIDSGSNGLFFTDSTIPICTVDADFFCPATTLGLSATQQGANGTSGTVTFSVGNAQSLFGGNHAAFDDLAGPAAAVNSTSFDWGLPFFFGRNVFVAIAGSNTTGGGPGPYWAY